LPASLAAALGLGAWYIFFAMFSLQVFSQL
jgi:hypothetical protein